MKRIPETAASDLRSFLEALERAGRLRRVSAAVDKDTELACIARWAAESTSANDAYAILFENVRGFDSPVAANLFPTRAAYAAALGLTPERVLDRWADAMQQPRAPLSVASAPVHEVVRLGEQADLSTLPIPVWTPGRDAGPYLSAAAVITRDPDTGVQNVGTYRVQIQGPHRTGLFFGSERQHGAMHMARYRRRGERMPVAIVVGGPPAVCFAAAAKTAYGVDELHVAGGLAGAPIEVVPGRTVDLLVPARAECVIEGFVDPDALADEGPFGEALGYMAPPAPAPFVEVSAICTRDSPIHHGYIQQLPPTDGHLVWEYGALGPLWFYLTRKLNAEGIRDLAILRGAAGLSALVVQVQRGGPLSGAAAGQVLARLHFGQKLVYVVDDDIDIHDPETVNWAVSARVDPQRDIRLIDGTTMFQVDPAVLARAGQDGDALDAAPYKLSMAVIDATTKCAVPELSLPTDERLRAVLARWPELGLPPLEPRPRLTRLVAPRAAPRP